MDHGGPACRLERYVGAAVGVLLLVPLAALVASGCGKEQTAEAQAQSVRVPRYRCNIAPAHDVVDVYAEVVNEDSHRTGPLDLVARVIRPDEDVVEGRTSIGRLRGHEARQVSMRFMCKGYVASRHISLAVESTPTTEPADSRSVP